MKNAIFLDFKPSNEWAFLKALEKSTKRKYEYIFVDSHNLQGSKKILRYLSYIFKPLLYVITSKYDLIIAWQQFYGLFYAFWLRLFKRKKTTTLIVLTFIYKKKNGIIGTIYDKLMRYIVEGAYIDKFICFSDEECKKYSEYFGLDINKFASCKLEIEDSFNSLDSNEQTECEEFYLTAGRSNRDYNFLCEAFKKMPSRKLVVICDSELKADLPSNIIWLNNVHGTEYLKYISQCRAVIVPLNTLCGDISAGQMVIIQGMMYGKIVIATNTLTTGEYIQNKKNGILINNTFPELDEVLYDIEDGKYEYIEQSAREFYVENYSKSNIAEAVRIALSEIERKET